LVVSVELADVVVDAAQVVGVVEHDSGRDGLQDLGQRHLSSGGFCVEARK